MPKRIHETVTAPILDAPATTPGRILTEIISAGWGSSGYYSPKVLDNAVAEKVWPAGTHVYLDHPTDAEDAARPARTVRDLVAKLAEDARKDDQGRIVAEVDVFGPFRPLVTDKGFAEAVGMSIRAYADSTIGEAEGRKGQIITRIIPDQLNSVDIVTHAGRGGRILAVLESLRPGAPAEEATVSDQREALEVALDAAYGGEKSYVGIRDFDPDTGQVWFWYENPPGSGTWQESYTTDAAGTVTLSGAPIEVRAKTTYVPVAQSTPAAPVEVAAPTNVPVPAGPTTPTKESKEDTMPQIEEGRLAQLEEAAGRVPTLEAERDTARRERDQAVAESRQIRNTEAARAVIAEAIAASTTPVTFTALESRGLLAGLPTTTEGDLDEAAYRTAVEAAVAEKAKAGGAGQVRGFGASEDSGADTKSPCTWGDIDKIMSKGA